MKRFILLLTLAFGAAGHADSGEFTVTAKRCYSPVTDIAEIVQAQADDLAKKICGVQSLAERVSRYEFGFESNESQQKCGITKFLAKVQATYICVQ